MSNKATKWLLAGGVFLIAAVNIVTYLWVAHEIDVLSQLSARTAADPRHTAENTVFRESIRDLRLLSGGLFIGAVVVFSGFVFLLADLERKRRTVEGRFRTIFEEAPLGIALLDAPTGAILNVNRRFAELAGRTVEEMQSVDWENISHPDDLPAHAIHMDQLNSGAIPGIQAEKRFVHPDGSLVWVSMSMTPIEPLDDRHPRHLCMIKDVTDRREMEAQIRQAQKMNAVGQMTGGVAHDFNNILMVLSGNIELLERQVAGDDKAQRFISNTKAAAKRGAEMTRRLLAFSRRQALEPKTFKLDGLVWEMDDMLRRTLSEDIDIAVNLPADLWPVTIDPGQLEIAILNLVVNARDAMPEGGRLTIEAANITLDDAYAASQDELEANDYVVLSVSDTGVGMTEDIVEQVFEPFFTTKPKGEGTGLGLSMVYGFIKQSKGHIKVYSEPGHGTTIRLFIPRVMQETPVVREARAPVEEVLKGRETVLVVEDDLQVRDVAVAFLREAGYQAIEAEDAQEALRSIEDMNRLDLLFTDVVLPGGMNGAQLAARVKEILPKVKVLYTTGYAENAIVHTGKLDEGVDLISKPYARDDLLRKVRDVLDGE